MIEAFFEETNVTFGGYPVKIMEEHGGILVNCKGVTGTLDQLEDWLNNHKKDQITKCYFGFGDKLSEIVLDGDVVKIACLQEKYGEFKLKLKRFIHECRRERSI